MAALRTFDTSIVSLIILIFIYINAYNRSEKFLSNRLFVALVQINILLIIIDIFGWMFSGMPETTNMILNKGFNLLLYIAAPLGPTVWVLYADYQVFGDEIRISKAKWPLIIPFSVNALASILSLFTGWFFYVDAQNVYHRGEYFWLHVAYCFILILYSFYLILVNRHRLERGHYFSLLLFFLLPSIGMLIQAFYYGVSYNWVGMMLSLLLLYLYIQNHELNIDHLTGVYNRRQLERYVKAKIRSSSEKKTFSAILLDLDEFKKINDSFGHDTGDEALKDAVAIIRKSLRQNDFVARFGGDEFVVILDIDSLEMLELAVQRIRHNAELFNSDLDKPYRLSFSMGYDTYDVKAKMKFDDFIMSIDLLMYKDKKQYKGLEKDQTPVS